MDMKNFLQLKAQEIGIILLGLILVMMMQMLWLFLHIMTISMPYSLLKKLLVINRHYLTWWTSLPPKSGGMILTLLLWMRAVSAKRLWNQSPVAFRLALRPQKKPENLNI